MRINKQQLAEDIMLHNVFESVTKTQVLQFVEDFFTIIEDKVVAGDVVAIAGFGVFSKYQKTDGTFKPKFSSYKSFKEAVNN